ncbi:MAG TPA: hypothetical protein VIJ91_01645 [Candidatus Dormibacteraeota bacterium]
MNQVAAAVAGFLAVLVLAAGGAVLARAWLAPPSLAGGMVAESVPTPRRVILWRIAGLVVGLAGGYLVSNVNLGIGIGPLLSMPVIGGGVLAGVLVGELTAPGPGRTPTRQAQLEIRQVTDYLPRRMLILVGFISALLALVLCVTTLVAVPDDLGRAGRALSVVCADGTTSQRSPWPGIYYSAPTAVVVLLGFILAALTVRRIARRPRVSTDSASRALEDAIRRQTAFTVSAAYGVLVAGPLTGIGLISGLTLLDNCGPLMVHAGGWALVAIGVGALVALCWFMLAILFPRLTGPPPFPEPSEG